jgi:hypothetical protein
MDVWGVYGGRQPAGTKERFDSYDAEGGAEGSNLRPRVAMSAMEARDIEKYLFSSVLHTF